MDQATPDEIETSDTHEPVELDPQRVLAVLCDSRASTLLLEETMTALIQSQSLEHVLLEVETVAGRAIAGACLKAEIQYTVMDFGGMIEKASGAGIETGVDIASGPEDEQIAELRGKATQIIDMDPALINRLRAQLCIVPAPVGAGIEYLDPFVAPIELDLSPTTLPGLTFAQARDASRALVLIDTPERGIIREVGSSHRRRILHVGAMVAEHEQPAHLHNENPDEEIAA